MQLQAKQVEELAIGLIKEECWSTCIKKYDLLLTNIWDVVLETFSQAFYE
jgi:hypothetical protein